MGRIEALTAYQMAKRISERKENIYDIGTIKNILDAYMDECYKALLDGERVQISKVGTIIPEVKTHEHFNLPICNKEGGNPPYTRFRISRNNHMGEEMNRTLMQNVKNGIYGLKKLPFSKQQMDILKNSGYIPEDAQTEDMEGE